MQTVIVTGASGNLGKAVIQKFLSEKWQVAGTVTTRQGDTEEAFEKIAVDLSDEAQAESFVAGVVKKYESVNAAVLTVGGFAAGKIADASTSDVLKQYQLNFETAYNTARPVFVQMLKQGHGRIFLIGSKAGLDAKNGKGVIAYSLAKSLIFRLAELMNEEANGKDVVTTVIVPGTIDTPQNRKDMPDADFSKWVKPEAIADVIYFYCTDTAAIAREPVVKVFGNS